MGSDSNFRDETGGNMAKNIESDPISPSNLFNLPDDQKHLLNTNAPVLTSMGKTAYFDAMLPILMRQGI